ncbi:MAG: choice-of-anchor D domain-containing protein, partial [Terracidiphilus sp.]
MEDFPDGISVGPNFRAFMLHPCGHGPLPDQLHASGLARLFGWCTGLLGVVFCSIALSGCGSVAATSTNTAATGTLVGSPATVNFGTVTVGQSASAKVSLLNQGPGSVEISKLTLAGQSFAFSGQGNLPVTLAAGSSLSLNVQFAPTAAGAVSDQLTVTSS